MESVISNFPLCSVTFTDELKIDILRDNKLSFIW